MAYSDFTLDIIGEKLNVDNRRTSILTEFKPVLPSNNLVNELKEVEELPIRSEKAKSEWIVVPILKELRKRNDKFFK